MPTATMTNRRAVAAVRVFGADGMSTRKS